MRVANRKIQKLFPFVKMVNKSGSVLIHLQTTLVSSKSGRQECSFLARLYEHTGRAYCTISCVGVSGGCLEKMLKFYVKAFESDGHGAVRGAILYADRSCFSIMWS